MASILPNPNPNPNWNQACGKYPAYRDWMLSTEAIPMARRIFQRTATVAEIAKRLGVGASESHGAGAGGGGGTGNGGQQQEIRRLRLLVDGLCTENEQLWAAVEGLQATVEGLVAQGRQ